MGAGRTATSARFLAFGRTRCSSALEYDVRNGGQRVHAHQSRLMKLAEQRKIVVSAHIALDFPGKGSIAVHVDGPLLVAAPPGPERRACGGVASRQARCGSEDEDDGQRANQ